MISSFIIIVLTCLSTEGYSIGVDDPCTDQQMNTLFANGPCQQTMTYCQNGKAMNLSCSDSMIFNPGTKFCERPEDFIPPQSPEHQHAYVVSKIPDETRTSDVHTNPSVFVQPTFVGQTGSQTASEAQPIPSVFVHSQTPPNVHQIGSQPKVANTTIPSPSCPEFYTYNPATRFCQHVQSLQYPSLDLQSVPAIPSVFYQPFVGQMDSQPPQPMMQSNEDFGTNPSVFMQHMQENSPWDPANDAHPVAVQMQSEEDNEDEGVEDSYPSVFVSTESSQIERPFVGQVPHSSDESQSGEADPSPSVFMPSSKVHSDYAEPSDASSPEDYQPDSSPSSPEEMESEEELVRREGPPHSAVQTDDSAYDGPQLVEENSRSADDSSSPPQMPPSPLDDGIEVADEFIFGENVQEAQSGEAEYKALVDDFHANKLPAQPKMSAFAPLDSQAEADHDAFKVATPRKVERSGFAPMDTQIEAGHDAFRDQPTSNSRPSKRRYRRSIGVKNSAAGSAVASAPTNSTKQGGEEDGGLAVCRQMFAQQLARRASTGNTNGKACAQHEVPAGCRQFYLACVNGRQLRRQCPAGLFFEPTTETCKPRTLVSACQLHRPPTVLAQEAKKRQQQKPQHKLPAKQQMPSAVVETQAVVKPANTEQYRSNNTNIVPTPTAPSSGNPIPSNVVVPAPTLGNGTKASPLPASVHPVVSRRQQQQQQQRQKAQQQKQQPQPTPIVPPTYAQFAPDNFCSELPDGFYRHPKNCSRILQCFGHQLFEFPSCQHDLAFNERTGVCDYRQNVAGCAQPDGNGIDVEGTSSSSATDSELAHRLDQNVEEQVNAPDHESSTTDFAGSSNGHTAEISGSCLGGRHSHGDHIEQPAHCSGFLRCVWGRLVPMSCPRGTAFNPRLSVCDYPGQVPNCQAA